MKLINYSLLLFISIFIFLSFVIEPVRFGENNQTNFSNDLPEINLNIALDDNVSVAESSDIDINTRKMILERVFPQLGRLKLVLTMI